MFENRNFMIFSTSELDLINFDEVLETSKDTIRKNNDESKTFVKWEGEVIPPSVFNLTTKEGPYSYNQIIEILELPEWRVNYSENILH